MHARPFVAGVRVCGQTHERGSNGMTRPLGVLLLTFLLWGPVQAMSLIGHGEVTHTAVADGGWFDSATWDAGVPGEGAVAHVPAGRNVSYAGTASSPIHAVLVEGTLRFATDQSSHLLLDTLEVGMGGELIIGTISDPVQSNVTVHVEFVSDNDIDVIWDPELISRGLVAHGRVEIHGQRKTVHTKVAVDPLAGHNQLQLSEVPVAWRVGDTLVLTGTRYSGWKWDNAIQAVRYHGTQDEVVAIAAIDGALLTLNETLEYDHTTPRADLKASVANLTRNIRFSTAGGEDAEVHRRGHVMLMHHTDFDVRYAAFDQLGRTDKRVASFDLDQLASIDSTSNVRGRYPLHLHISGIDQADQPAMIIGNAVRHSPGWGYAHHASNAVFHNNASFDTHGAGFVAETGDEIGSWTANIAIKAEGNSAFNPKNGNDVDGFDMARSGVGFWFQGRMVRTVGNVAASVNNGYAYLHRGTRMRGFPNTAFTMPEALRRASPVSSDHPPILNFHDNEAFASTVGLFVVKANPNQGHDIHTHMSSFTAWEVRGGAAMEYTSHYLLEDFDIIGSTPEPFRSPIFGIEFGTNTSDMVINRAMIANMPTGVRLGKDFTDPHPPEVNQYVMIDVEFDNVDEHYEDLDIDLDLILTASELQLGQFDVVLNGGMPLEYLNPATTAGTRLDFIGSKVDSIGPSPVPAGTDRLGVPNQEMIAICAGDGYYRSPTGEPYVIVSAYFTNRADGRIHKIGLIIRLGPDVEVLLGNQHHAWRDAFERGPINLNSQPPVTTDNSAVTGRNSDVVIDVLANDHDPDGDPLVVDGIVQPHHGLVFYNPDGTLTYRPDPDFSGQDRFQYWASDGQGHFTPAVVTVTVLNGDVLFRDRFSQDHP